MNMSGFSDHNDTTLFANRSAVNLSDSTIAVCDFIFYLALAMGIPGNILSAIVWLRGPVISKNSSSVYLAALAIVDLANPLFTLITEHLADGWWLRVSVYLHDVTVSLEPLLVLGFSVERLIAILRPLQVCMFCFPWILACLLVVVRRYRRRRCTVESGRSVVSTHMASKSRIHHAQ